MRHLRFFAAEIAPAYADRFWRHGRSDMAASPSLEGLAVDVAALFDAPKPTP